MRRLAYACLTALVVLAAGASAQGQEGPVGFDDVPPWHWAYDSLQRLGAAGIMIGYPTSDRDRAINAVTQIYDAFAHAAHPDARFWAERFLITLPPTWPQPLQRSSLLSFRLENALVESVPQGAVVSLVATVTLRTPGGTASSRVAVRAELRRDPDGRLRVSYATLVAAQPEIFK